MNYTYQYWHAYHKERRLLAKLGSADVSRFNDTQDELDEKVESQSDSDNLEEQNEHLISNVKTEVANYMDQNGDVADSTFAGRHDIVHNYIIGSSDAFSDYEDFAASVMQKVEMAYSDLQKPDESEGSDQEANKEKPKDLASSFRSLERQPGEPITQEFKHTSTAAIAESPDTLQTALGEYQQHHQKVGERTETLGKALQYYNQQLAAFNGESSEELTGLAKVGSNFTETWNKGWKYMNSIVPGKSAGAQKLNEQRKILLQEWDVVKHESSTTGDGVTDDYRDKLNSADDKLREDSADNFYNSQNNAEQESRQLTEQELQARQQLELVTSHQQQLLKRKTDLEDQQQVVRERRASLEDGAANKESQKESAQRYLQQMESGIAQVEGQDVSSLPPEAQERYRDLQERFAAGQQGLQAFDAQGSTDQLAELNDAEAALHQEEGNADAFLEHDIPLSITSLTGAIEEFGTMKASLVEFAAQNEANYLTAEEQINNLDLQVADTIFATELGTTQGLTGLAGWLVMHFTPLVMRRNMVLAM